MFLHHQKKIISKTKNNVFHYKNIKAIRNNKRTGQDISELITTGIYRWSRNPQFVGWFLMLLGISLAGRSGFAFMLTGVFVIVIYLYTILLAEPYLESLHGEDYRLFKKRTARWIEIPDKNNEDLSG